MNNIDWAKSNKDRLVQRIAGGVKPSTTNQEPVAVFAAGIPGAGKTEFLNRLLNGIDNIVRIDMDEIVKEFEGYTPENYYEYRGAANIILDEIVIYCRKKRLDFVLDGTFGSPKAVENIRHALKRHKIVMFYVWKEPRLAWQHTKDREVLTKRGIEKQGFIDACFNVPKNVSITREKFGSKIFFAAIRKNPENDDFQMTENIELIDGLLEVDYTKGDLERILQ